jgi:peptide/nickel transport system permease protein
MSELQAPTPAPGHGAGVAPVAPALDADVVGAGPGRRSVILHAILGRPQALVGGIVLLVFVLVALFAPLIAPYGDTQKVGGVFGHPNGSHLLGLDDGGFDVLSLLIYGARVSLIVGFAASLVAMLLGGTVGVLAGYFGGWIDTLMMRVTDYFYAIPDVPLTLVVSAIFGRSLRNIVLIIGIIYWASTARVIRAQVKSVRERTYVRRAEALGASHTRIVTRHVVPQVAPLLVANTVLMVAYAIFLETAISFLGLGDPSLTSWGKMIENAFERSAISVGAWWAIVPPGVAVTVVITACAMLGTALEDALNPRLRVSHLSVRRYRLRQLEREERS